MTSVRQWTGQEAKALRNALRMTMQEFAYHLGVNPRTIGKWEAAGRGTQFRAETQSMLDTALLRAPEEARRRFAQVARSAATVDGMDGGKSYQSGGRYSSELSSNTVGHPQLSLQDLQEFSRTLDEARDHQEDELTGYFEQRLGWCHSGDGLSGPQAVLPIALSIIAAVDACARYASLPVQRHLLSLASRGAEFVSWLYRDAGSPRLVIYWCDRAMEWAQEAGDGPMQSYILLKKSQFAWDGRDGQRILSLARAARAVPWSLPMRVKAEILQQEARGHAMVGGDQETIERNLSEAQQLLLDSRELTAPEAGVLARHYQPVLLNIQIAICYDAMGWHTRAVDAFADAIRLKVLPRRDHGYFTSLMAHALVSVGEPDEAAERGLEAHTIAIETESIRTIRELHRLATELQPWVEREPARKLVDAMRGY